MLTPKEKGDRLEQAVLWIEKTILSSSPELQKNKFNIEPKKRFVVEGVTHEVDVYVEVDHGDGYVSKFLFECKNWKDPVGKNEIIIFSEKIDALVAQKGFFVAKTFAKDAIAQIKKDTRIEKVTVTEIESIAHNVLQEEIDSFTSGIGFQFLSHENLRVSIIFTQRGSGKPRPGKDRDSYTEVAVYHGIENTIDEISKDWQQETWDIIKEKVDATEWDSDPRDFVAEKEFQFEPGELVADGKDIASVIIEIKVIYRVTRPPMKIATAFSVEDRGRAIVLEPWEIAGKKIILTHVRR